MKNTGNIVRKARQGEGRELYTRGLVRGLEWCGCGFVDGRVC